MVTRGSRFLLIAPNPSNNPGGKEEKNLKKKKVLLCISVLDKAMLFLIKMRNSLFHAIVSV